MDRWRLSRCVCWKVGSEDNSEGQRNSMALRTAGREVTGKKRCVVSGLDWGGVMKILAHMEDRV